MWVPSGGAWPGSSAHRAVGVASGVVGGFGVCQREDGVMCWSY
jgi:hypothetical protein